MNRGLSLHVGLNAVDPDHYAGWAGPLNACEADARDMKTIADSQGFGSSILLTAEATRTAVLDGIAQAAGQLAAGDIFLLTVSSHGGQVPDLNGDESDGLDETWCLYDGQLIDDELSLALTDFAPGVRVLVISDSCHSGTVVKTAAMQALYGDLLSVQRNMTAWAGRGDRWGQLEQAGVVALPVPRVMPTDVTSRVYLENKNFYDGLGSRAELKNVEARVSAAVILLSGCQDNQLSMDGPFNGAFTGQLKRTWNGGAYKRNYDDFITDIRKGLNDPTQSPGIFRIGNDDATFNAQRPFLLG
ncbi:peptidase C14 [Sphingomonas sp. HMWF008]|nr:peptidase C14 [Sphingomonas sp. HMWF008]